jgi:hypothetical protein
MADFLTIVANIATIIGGVAALLVLYDRFITRRREGKVDFPADVQRNLPASNSSASTRFHNERFRERIWAISLSISAALLVAGVAAMFGGLGIFLLCVGCFALMGLIHLFDEHDARVCSYTGWYSFSMSVALTIVLIWLSYIIGSFISGGEDFSYQAAAGYLLLGGVPLGVCFGFVITS